MMQAWQAVQAVRLRRIRYSQNSKRKNDKFNRVFYYFYAIDHPFKLDGQANFRDGDERAGSQRLRHQYHK